jgi:hypothetical protein
MDLDAKTPRMMNWALQPRPRSPEQFISMMSVVVNFNGVKWWEKDSSGEPANQIAVLDAIKNHSDFSLIPKSESVMQGRTYVTMNPPTLGFLYISNEKKTEDKLLVITPAGYQCAKGENLQTLFLKQLLKWQYPSFVHGGPGGKGAAHFPLKDRWSIHPLLSTLEICRELDYVSKTEMATYILTMVKDSEVEKVIEEIKTYRKEIDSTIGSRAKEEKRNKILKEKMLEVYADEIDNGRFKKRQEDPHVTKEVMIEKMIEAKMRNNHDYTDTVMRYFRFTGLFKESGRWQNLKINPYEKWKVDEILKNKEKYSVINMNYNDDKKFYGYFGNTNEPKLPWETQDGLLKAIFENLNKSLAFLGSSVYNHKETTIGNINKRILFLNKILHENSIKLNVKIDEMKSDIFEELVKYSESTQIILKEIGRMVVSNNFKTDEEFKVTKQMLNNVVENKKWIDPYMEVNLLLEWSLYRSIYGLGGNVISGYGPKLNYDGTEPIFTSIGVVDIGADFDKSHLLLEGTITSGVRQYDTEAEPVTRHIADFIHNQLEKKPTLCFFIARDLNENVKEYFALYNVYHKHPTIQEYLNIIPINITKYIKIIDKIRGKKSTDGEVFVEIIKKMDELRDKSKCACCKRPTISSDDWYKEINEILDNILK